MIRIIWLVIVEGEGGGWGGWGGRAGWMAENGRMGNRSGIRRKN